LQGEVSMPPIQRPHWQARGGGRAGGFPSDCGMSTTKPFHHSAFSF
jgi:hypothetical protein